MPDPLQQALPTHVDVTLQAATDQALSVLLMQHGLLVAGEAGIHPAPGVVHSHIGAGVLPDGTELSGRYAFVGLDPDVLGADAVASLLVALTPHRYIGPDLRVRLGGRGFDDTAVVPQAVTMRQARLALLAAGKLDAITAAIASIQNAATRAAAQVTWEYSTEVQRHNGLVAQLGPALGLTDADIDALFVAARAL